MLDSTQFTYLSALVAAGGIGLAIGSFINALEYRVQHGLSIVRTAANTKKRSPARSMCPQCKHQLHAGDLVPVVSFLLLRGRCRYCGKPIHWQYPVVELAAALACILATAVYGVSLDTVIVSFFALVLLFIFVYDLKYQLILDSVTLPLIPIAFVLSIARGLEWRSLLLGALVGGGVFAVQYLLSRGRWIGGGDIRLGVLMGVMLGFPVTLAALFFAYLFGALVGLILLAYQKAGLQTRIAFGTFLSASTFLCLLWGVRVVEWYVHLLV